MILNIKHEADWNAILQWKQAVIDKNNNKENASQIPYSYAIGDKVLLQVHNANKYESPWEGPYDVLQVHNNGMVMIKMGPVMDVINIRHLVPYKS